MKEFFNDEALKRLVGKVIAKIETDEENSLFVNFTLDDGSMFEMYHEQDCCETVYLADLCGDPSDLVGYPVLLAEESSCNPNDDEDYNSCTWTFYKFATCKGYIDMRWIGESNGYYSESVTCKLTDNNADE